MLAKQQRLSRREFDRVFQHGVRSHTPYGQVIYTSAPSAKAAVVVSKKVAKSAVERNRLRRRVYSILENTTLPPAHYIFILKPSIRDIKDGALNDIFTKMVGVTHYSR